MDNNFIPWIISKHTDTNQWYDEQRGVQYKFHLELVADVGRQFKHLLKGEQGNTFPVKEPDSSKIWYRDIWENIVEPACYGHDAIEDARVTYNDIFKRSNSAIADICSALTNAGYGKNREERMPIERYFAILNTPFAVYVKLCDRIANVKYSIFWRSRMFDLYKKEQEHFQNMLYSSDYKGTDSVLCLDEMWDYLDNLFETKLQLA